MKTEIKATVRRKLFFEIKILSKKQFWSEKISLTVKKAKIIIIIFESGVSSFFLEKFTNL